MRTLTATAAPGPVERMEDHSSPSLLPYCSWRSPGSRRARTTTSSPTSTHLSLLGWPARYTVSHPPSPSQEFFIVISPDLSSSSRKQGQAARPVDHPRSRDPWRSVKLLTNRVALGFITYYEISRSLSASYIHHILKL